MILSVESRVHTANGSMGDILDMLLSSALRFVA
jgi:hypothetical protein